MTNGRPAFHWSHKGVRSQNRIEWDRGNRWHYNSPDGRHRSVVRGLWGAASRGVALTARGVARGAARLGRAAGGFFPIAVWPSHRRYTGRNDPVNMA